MNNKASKVLFVSLNKIASRVTLAATFLWTSSVGFTPAFAASQNSPLSSDPPDMAEPSVLLAQAADTILLFTTDRYDVRVFREGNQTLMNVYDATFDINRLFRGPTQLTIQNGQRTYISTGSFGGRQARFEAVAISPERARLVIRDGSGNIIANEISTSIGAFDLPDDPLQSAQNTILEFNTSTYAVRVFVRNDGNRFMNVFNRFTGGTEVNGNAASVAPPEPPYENAVSYVSSANRSGQPVEYFARIDGSGRTVLEIFNVNGQRIFQEAGQGPTVVNIPPEDLPDDLEDLRPNLEDAFVAAVFGDETTFQAVQRLFPDAFIVEARQGSFINVGSFSSRDAAAARVFELRGLGFNARLVFQDVDFR